MSVFKALLPLPAGDAGAMLTPTHALNPLRAATYVVALALMALPLGLLLRHQPHRCLEQFTRGLGLSLVGIGLVVLEQRGVLTLLMENAGVKAAVDAALTTEPSVPGPFAEARFAAWATPPGWSWRCRSCCSARCAALTPSTARGSTGRGRTGCCRWWH